LPAPRSPLEGLRRLDSTHPGGLYLLIADEIEDKSEKKAFIRRAISVSGKE
jgi:hypothetical protein